jgi:hypothetical protein
MYRQHTIAGVLVLASAVLTLALGYPAPVSAASSSSREAHVHRTAVTSFDNAKITAICDRADPNESMGLSKPTEVDRVDGVDAVIFATSIRYGACIVLSANGTYQSKPTLIRQISKGVGELESFATLNKVPDRALYTTDTWFVVRVSPSVATVKAVTRGSTQVSKVRDDFAFVHEKETANVKGKFVYGVAAGFSAGGELVGTTPLS